MTEATYRIPDEVMVAELEGEAVLLHMETKRYYRLNETGAWILEGLRDGLDREGLVEHLVGEFRVAPEEAAEELDDFLERLVERELVDLVDGPR